MVTIERETSRSAPPLRRAFGGRYGFLLTSLIALVAISPAMVAKNAVLVNPLDLLVFTIMFAGLRAADPGRHALVFGIFLTAITLASHCAAYLLVSRTFLLCHHALTLSALIYALTTILSAIIEDTRVTLETLKAAVCVYLLIGLAFVFAFALVAIVFPDSFLSQTKAGEHVTAELTIRSSLPELMYFSFATLTTLGYADLIPHSAPAKTLCYVEAVLGQFYVTILIARLVGMHISRNADSKS